MTTTHWVCTHCGTDWYHLDDTTQIPPHDFGGRLCPGIGDKRETGDQ